MKLERTCIVCRSKFKKNELIRIVSKDGIAVLDSIQKINSRGIYFCKSRNCLEMALKLIDKNKLNVKIPVSKESLKEVISNCINELEE